MNDWLFDPPWWGPILLAIVALALLYQGVQSLKGNVKVAGLIAAALAVVWLAAANWVETGKEKAIRQTKDLAAAVDARDWKTFKTLLDPTARFAIFANREELTAGAAKTADRVGVKDIVITDPTAVDVPGGVDVTFTATASIGAIDRRAPTNWKFTWAKNSDGSELLYQIEALSSPAMGGGMDTEAVTTRLVK